MGLRPEKERQLPGRWVGMTAMMVLLSLLLLIEVAWLFHANSKFQECARLWDAAQTQNNHPDMELYYRCERIAHRDSFILTSPVTIWERWNADYVAEAKREGGR